MAEPEEFKKGVKSGFLSRINNWLKKNRHLATWVVAFITALTAILAYFFITGIFTLNAT